MSNGGHLYIEPSVLLAIGSYRQHYAEVHESGGFLVGYYKGIDLHVSHITTPFSKDKCGRYYFHRRDSRHVKLVSQWYKDSDGQVNCLGEWHTHPEKFPTPSGIDISGWKKFVGNRRGQKAIFFIAGTHGYWTGELK